MIESTWKKNLGRLLYQMNLETKKLVRKQEKKGKLLSFSPNLLKKFLYMYRYLYVNMHVFYIYICMYVCVCLYIYINICIYVFSSNLFK